jgi:UDPglucose--hexose-1-phosphate uridylyltransferase
MSEIRRDIFTGRWIIVEEATPVEPSHFHFKKVTHEPSFCPFCETNEALTPPEVFALRRPDSHANGPGWTVRVVPNFKPRLHIEGQLNRRAEGFHDLMNGVGAHEVVIETPRHDLSLHQLEPAGIAAVLETWVARIKDLRQDERLRYVVAYKNHGEAAGAHVITHSISQLLALPVTPRSLRNKLTVSKEYYAAKERCIYCDVLQQERKDQRRLVAENEHFVAFAPFASRFPFETMILPKAHASDFAALEADQIHSLAPLLRDVLQRLDHTVGSPPYNLSLHNSPQRRRHEGYWTTVDQDFHWHFDILPQIFPLEGFEWASGFYYNPVAPEVAARCLAEAPLPAVAAET